MNIFPRKLQIIIYFQKSQPFFQSPMKIYVSAYYFFKIIHNPHNGIALSNFEGFFTLPARIEFKHFSFPFPSLLRILLAGSFSFLSQIPFLFPFARSFFVHFSCLVLLSRESMLASLTQKKKKKKKVIASFLFLTKCLGKVRYFFVQSDRKISYGHIPEIF